MRRKTAAEKEIQRSLIVAFSTNSPVGSWYQTGNVTRLKSVAGSIHCRLRLIGRGIIGIADITVYFFTLQVLIGDLFTLPLLFTRRFVDALFVLIGRRFLFNRGLFPARKLLLFFIHGLTFYLMRKYNYYTLTSSAALKLACPHSSMIDTL